MENKIKVLHVGMSDNIGGIETVVRSWHKYLPEDIVFDFVNNNEGKLAFEEEFKATGAQIYKIPSRKSNYRESYNALKKIVENGMYDYLHFHAMSLSWPEPIIISGKSNKTQGIIHSHMVVDKNMSLKYRILHTVGKLRLLGVDYHELACGSDAGRTMFGNNKYRVIPNGIELERFSFSEGKRKEIRTKLGISENEFVIGHVGRPGPQKNYPFLFKTISEMIQERRIENLKLLLLGDIKNDPEISSLEKEYKLSSHIVYAGYVKDASSYYSAMDVFFFPSLYEGFSVSLVEAQAAGLPCVASENVAKESSLTESFIFVGLSNTTDSKEAIEKTSEAPVNRTVRAELQYDIRETSKQMFDYYRAHIKKG